VALPKPLRRPLRFEIEVPRTGTYFHLYRLGLSRMRLGLHLAALFLLRVLKFTIIHYFFNRGVGIGRDLYEVEIGILGSLDSLGQRQNAQVFSLGSDDAHLLGADLVVNPSSIQVLTLYHIPLIVQIHRERNSSYSTYYLGGVYSYWSHLNFYMKNKYFAAVLGVSMFFSSVVPASAASLTSTQINAILSILQSFGVDQATITRVSATLSGTATGQLCVVLSNNMGLGATDATTGGEVTKLQNFLIKQSGRTDFTATGYYGKLTARAVGALQISRGIVTSESDSSFGIVGPKTRAAVNCIIGATGTGSGTGTQPPLSSGTGATVQKSPQYLLFQQSITTVTGQESLDTKIGELVSDMGGEKGDHVNEQLGFVVGPLSFDLTDDQMRFMIDESFRVAKKYNVAAGFHIDDSMFWVNRTDLWQNPKNVEWSDWNGTVVPHRTINSFLVPLSNVAPPMCYNAAEIKTETARRARDVIGAQIKKNVDTLTAEGKGYLFAGVIAGWETQLQDHSNPPVYYGYCALTNLGYSASNPPKDKDAVLADVVHDWIELWSQNLEQAGIPRSKINTHIVFLSDPPTNIANPIRDFYHDAPPDPTAFNSYSHPGFSFYDDDGNGTAFNALYSLLAKYNNSPWGISEGDNITITHAVYGGTGTQTMEQYLARAFNHGATYVNLFGWSDPATSNFYKAAVNDEALAAYRKFLSGQKLVEGPTASLTVNGTHEVWVKVGESVKYDWKSTGAVSATSFYTVDSPDTCTGDVGPFIWNVNTLSGSEQSIGKFTCQSGHTYTATFKVTDANGKTASDTIIEHVR
jgi:hypothetical protein